LIDNFPPSTTLSTKYRKVFLPYLIFQF